MNAMASTIAHELNQPLTAAANYLWVAKQMVERGTSSVADLSSSIGTALGQVLHAGDIIKRVRAMVSDRQDSRRLESLPAMVDDVMRLFCGDDARACRISADLNADAERVFVDRVQFKQVLTNLIRNAIEACDPDRIPTIRIKALLQADKLVKISVEDNGSGFPSHRDDPFSGLWSEKGEGLGLGLSISRSIVEAHGGSIAIDRTGADGTVVSFTVCASAP
jgi:two-component system sensor kinase FixL